MTRCIVDSATLVQIVQSLDLGLRPQYQWSARTATGLTAVLLSNDSGISIAPGLPRPDKPMVLDGYSDLMAQMLRHNLAIQERTPSRERVHRAFVTTKQWAGRTSTHTNVRRTLETMWQDSRNYRRWYSWACRNTMQFHSKRYHGVFDLDFLSALASILNLDSADLKDLQQRTQRSSELAAILRRPDSLDFRVMSDAFLASALLRGRFHEQLAKILNNHLTRHPIRESIKLGSHGPTTLQAIPDAFTALARLIMYAASKHEPKLRRAAWAEYIALVRSHMKETGLRPIADHPEPQRIAVDLARDAGVPIAPTWADKALSFGIPAAAGILTGISVAPWAKPVGRALAKSVLGKARLGTSILYRIRRTKLERLAAGGVETRWTLS